MWEAEKSRQSGREYKKDFPYDDLLEDTDLPGTKTHTNIKVKVDKKMATQTLVYEPEFDADGNEISFKPTKDNCDIIDDIDNKQSQRTLGHAMKLMSALGGVLRLSRNYGPWEANRWFRQCSSNYRHFCRDASCVGAATDTVMQLLPGVKSASFFDAKSANKLGYISAGVDGAKGIGYAIKAMEASTDAAKERYAQKAVTYMVDGGLNALAVAVPVVGGPLAVYSITTGLLALTGYGNPIASSLVGTPGAAALTIFMVFSGSGIPSAIIDSANEGAINMFYSNQEDLFCNGHEMVSL